MKVTSEPRAFISPHVIFEGSARVGYCSYVGYGSDPSSPTIIGNNVEIGAFCLIFDRVHIEADVEVDHYCRIGSGSKVGYGTKILYGSQVFDNVQIGANCIIGGHVIDRTIIEDNVTYSG